MTIEPRAGKIPSSRALEYLLSVVAIVSAAAVAATYAGRWPRSRLEHPIFDRLFAFEDHRSAIAATLAFAAVAAIPVLRRTGVRLVQYCASRPRRLVVLAGVLMALAAHGAYLNHALSMDEYAPRAQAHAFAQGSLAATIPREVIEFAVPFDGLFQAADAETGRVASAYWPGLALIMAPFAALDVEWIVNPLFSMLALWLIFRLASDGAASQEAGTWAVLVAIASAAFVVNGISYYAMQGLLALNLLFAWLLLKGTKAHALLAGLVGGLALVLHNPVPHALFAAPWLAWLLLDQRRRSLLPLVLVGYAPLAMLAGVGWPMYLNTLNFASGAGDNDGSGAFWIGRVASVFAVPSGELLIARIQATWKIWIWAAPGLLVLALLGLRARPLPPIVSVGACSFALTYVAYFFVTFDQGHGWGYRYVHSAWGVLPIAAALAVARSWRGPLAERWREWTCGLVVAGLLALPIFLVSVRGIVVEHLAARIEPPAEGRWVVFVAFDPRLYTADLVQNFASDTRILRLLSRGPEADAEFMRSVFPGASISVADERGSAWRLPPAP